MWSQNTSFKSVKFAKCNPFLNPFQDAAQRSRQKRIEGTNLLKQKNIELRKEYAEENAFYGNLQEKVKNKERQYEELLRRKDKIHRWIERKKRQKGSVIQRNHS